MPELPEVETTCQGIRPSVVNQTIDHIIIRQPKLRWPIPAELKKLRKVKITAVNRRAKYILIESSQGTFIVHLGMSGRLCIVEKGTPIQKHDHVDFILTTGMILRYTDPRRFGAVLWTTDLALEHALLVQLGPEPLISEFNAAYLFKNSRNKTSPIKLLIMDQKMVVGVGNIYANEALHIAKISPLRKSSSLSLEECRCLVSAIKKILKKAILQGGTTLRDFLSSEGKPGYFKQKLLVYGRQGLYCLTCNEILTSTRLGQRITVYCMSCQN